MKNSLIIFTHDLRLNDQAVIDHVKARNLDFIPVYLDFFELLPSQEFFPLNVSKRKFMLNAVEHLKRELYLADKELVVIEENYREALIDLIRRHRCERIFIANQQNSPLTRLISSLEVTLAKHNIFIYYFDNNYLLDLEELPIPLKKIPKDFKNFTSKIKGAALRQIRDEHVVPDVLLDILEEIKNDEIPVLHPYKTRLNNHFSKFLPYLSSGLISPAQLLELIKNNLGVSPYFDKKAIKLFTRQLVYLDFVRLRMRDRDRDVFFEDELNHTQIRDIEKWIEGKTDNDLINAIMHKLRDTNMISLTSRRLAIMYYLKVLNLPAYFGYHYFENQLLEFDNSLILYLWTENDGNETAGENLELHLSDRQRQLDPKQTFVEFWN